MKNKTYLLYVVTTFVKYNGDTVIPSLVAFPELVFYKKHVLAVVLKFKCISGSDVLD